MNEVLVDWKHKAAILFIVIVPFVSLLAAIVLLWNRYVFVTDIVLLFVLHAATAMGVTIGYHRMLTHDSFKAPNWIRAIFLILGSMSLDGSPISWTATHICHHAHSDEEDDPHSPLDGFWHSHFGWLFEKNNFKEAEQYCPHLLNDPLVLFINRLFPLWTVLAFAIPFAIGGWTGLLWGGGVRVFFTNHVTWSVNSVCHTFGKRDFETTDQSTNNWIVGLLAFGEGWHNNHHAFPKNAFHGMRWYQFDLSGLIIRGLEKLGLVWDVQRVSHDQMEAQQSRAEKMKEVMADLRVQLGISIQHAQNELNRIIESAVEAGIEKARMIELQEMHDRARERLQEISQMVERAKNLKKQKLVSYAREVQDLVLRMKQVRA